MGEGLAENVLQRDLWEKSIRPPVICDMAIGLQFKEIKKCFGSEKGFQCIVYSSWPLG
jgi:hypothetical protein